jgi:hypothetical protein
MPCIFYAFRLHIQNAAVIHYVVSDIQFPIVKNLKIYTHRTCPLKHVRLNDKTQAPTKAQAPHNRFIIICLGGNA